MVKITKHNGFTLVEMLVSMVILSSVIVIATQAYKQFIVNSERFSTKYRSVLADTQKRELVFERLDQTILYIANKRDLFGNSTQSIYWQGYKNSLLSVTKISLQNPNKAAVFKLYQNEGELIYCEKVIDSWLPQIGKEPEGLCDYSLSILSNLESVQFSYFGWKDAFQKMEGMNAKYFNNFSAKKTWFKRYDSIEAELLPEWIALDITYSDSSKDRWMFLIKYQDPLRYRLLNGRNEV
ncbi:PulJ/GspJ family protein [Aliivibrio wodanis]|uniref:PulJ/GspJ family protein n=1 Tax=Aliivibrio wodanis TaxID=80852 RepID=UPI00406CC231